jgi:exo-1,4-beta-D-glucosaminidase
MTQRSAALILVSLSFVLSGPATAQTHSKGQAPIKSEHALTLRDGWLLQSSCKVDRPGGVISRPEFQPTGWYPVSVPTTVFSALVKRELYPDPSFGMNLRTVPGMTYPIGANFSNIAMEQDSPFMVPWWYRKEFRLQESYKGKTIWLDFGGINYRANIWLNGKQIANKKDVAGAWRTYEFNITKAALPGKQNVLAVEVFSPTEKDLAITFVDWYPAPPDKNMGLFRDVEIRTSGPVAVRYLVVVSKVDADQKAHLTVAALVKNGTNQPVEGVLKGRIEKTEFSQKVELGPNEQKDVTFDPTQVSQLNIDHLRLWWPAQMGKPELYKLQVAFFMNRLGNASFSVSPLSDSSESQFGIREITSELNANGKRVFSINGKKVLIRGGGMVAGHDVARKFATASRRTEVRAGHGVEHHTSRGQAGVQRIFRFDG